MTESGLSTMLALGPQARVAITGCGGKTTMVGLLADENKARAVLVMPTTKIRPPGGSATVCTGPKASLAHTPHTGVQYCANLDESTGKLFALPEEFWAPLAEPYGLVLMEADGSMGLPCKGWLADEPVVPGFATHTVGVMVLGPLGCPATEETVFRLPQFLRLTGARAGDEITMEMLADMVCLPEGLFRRKSGKTFLAINRVENAEELEKAEAFAALLRRRHPSAGFSILAGSNHQNRWRRL